MHITITVPNPLARLTHILAALERGRGGDVPLGPDRLQHPGRRESRGGTPADDAYDLGGLSLCRCDPPYDDREALSVNSLEWIDPGQHDDLSDLSLERDFPPRTGP